MNRIYVGLAISSLLFFRMYRYINHILQIKLKQDRIESLSTLIAPVEPQKNSLAAIAEELEKEEKPIDISDGEDSKEEGPEKPKPKPEPPAPHSDPAPDRPLDQMPRPQPASSQLVEEKPKPKPQPKNDLLKMQTFERKNTAAGTDAHGRPHEKDFFKTFFCRNFETIIKINKNEALDLDNQMKDPLILELKHFINVKKLQTKWSQSKVMSSKERMVKKLKIAGHWLLKQSRFLLVDILLEFLKNFFTNQFIVIFIETVIAIIYVIYSEKSWIILPIILWIFFNVYPRYDSSESLNLKIWLLMVPTGLNSLLSKRSSNDRTANSSNPDFNFAYKNEYQLIDISALGIVLIGFVVLEIILLTNSKHVRHDLMLPDGEKKPSTTNKIFSQVAIFIINNSFYLIVINIYLIALDINVINLGLIIYFIKLILTRKMTKKTLYSLFWYNQLSILFRYLYDLTKSSDAASSQTSSSQLFKMVGLTEVETDDGFVFSSRTKLVLNFVLQLLLIINIFKFRNDDLFKKMQEETTKEKMRQVFSTSSFKQTVQNLVDFAQYSMFHCLPWLSYLVIYFAMVVSSTNLVTLSELLLLSYVMVRHLRVAVENRFGGLDKMKGAWRAMLLYSALAALGRYVIRFFCLEYLRNKLGIQWFYDDFTRSLNFVGLLPATTKQAYLELAPSFLSMYLGSLVLSRIRVIEFTKENEQEILTTDLEEASEAPVIEVEVDPDDKSERRRSTIFRGKSALATSDEMKLRLNREEVESIQERNQRMKAKKVVLGHINVLKYAPVTQGTEAVHDLLLPQVLHDVQLHDFRLPLHQVPGRPLHVRPARTQPLLLLENSHQLHR